MEKENYSRLNKKTLRTFCISFSIGMLIIAVLSILRQILNPDILQINFIPAVITGTIAIYHQTAAWTLPDFPSLRRMHFSTIAVIFFYAANAVWKAVTFVIGTVVFSIIFYLIFTPTSVILKLTDHDHIKSEMTEWQKAPAKINQPEQCRKLF